MSRTLIAEDEPRIIAFLTEGLKVVGFTTHIAAGGGQAVALAAQEDFNLIILDMGLSDISDFEVLQQLRGQGVGTPIIMLTARSSVADRVVDLEDGVDDYMPKPFSLEELLTRTQVWLRPDTTNPDQIRLTRHDAVLNLHTRTLMLEGRTVELSVREFALAKAFMCHPGQVLSHEQLLDTVRGLDFDPGSNMVEIYVFYLHNKLGRQRAGTVRDMGYQLI